MFGNVIYLFDLYVAKMVIMENTNQDIAQENKKEKKVVDRSAAYAAYTIEDSLSFTSEFYKQFRGGPAKRDDILKLIEGTTNSRIAACSHYGFLSRDKDTYQITELYNTVVNYITEKEKQEALLTAFYNPKLNAEIIDKFDGDIIPENLTTHLYRFHRITQNAAPIAADIFLKNGKYVGVIDSIGKLSYKETMASLKKDFRKVYPHPTDFQNSEKVNNKTVENTINNTEETAKEEILPQHSSSQLLLPETINRETLTIRLTEGKTAILSYPRDFNQKDIAILKLQIDALELIL